MNSRAALLAFVTIAFSWSWGLGLLAGRTQTAGLSAVLSILAGFGPSVAGFAVVVIYGKLPGLRDWLASLLNCRFNPFWLVVAFLTPPVLMLGAVALYLVGGGSVPASPASGHLVLAVVNFGLVLLIGGPLGEEFGWRGYALPALKTRVSWQTASLIIGLVWGLWHLPLFFQTGTAQSHMPIAFFMLNILAGSVLFGWLSERTNGSVLPAIVLHTSLNAWAGILWMVPTAATATPYQLVTGLMVLLAVGALLGLKSTSRKLF